MNQNKVDFLDLSNASIKSTKENEELSSEYLNWQNKSNSENEKENKLIKEILNVFPGNNNISEFDDINYDISQNENNEFRLTKKNMQDNIISSFTDIKNAQNNIIKEKIFEINKICKKDKPVYRLDYYKKIFIKSFLQYLLNLGKKLIFDCNFGDKLMNLKLHMPNYKLYAGNPKEKDNRIFLTKTIKEVFMDYDVNCEKGTSRQKDNSKLINIIYKLLKEPISENEDNLLNFFEMTIERGIEIYYKSEEFKIFKNDELNRYYDNMFYNEKNRNFSLLEDNGFIKLVKMPFYSKFPK
jgi:hypothetical protein